MEYPKEIKATLASTALVITTGFLISIAGVLIEFGLFTGPTNRNADSEIAELRLLVKDSKGIPIQGAEITLLSNEIPIITRTDSSGSLSIPVRASKETEIEIQKDGYKKRRYVINLTENNNQTFVYTLDPIDPPKG
ncbi:carboxypeptidase-like regulatory domain-containing protein [Leptothoe sp. LEGE 181152]|nr:carboxypeptidase-like regulatory domain-containing protein [Leptothoe sp. LEGE 181152]